ANRGRSEKASPPEPGGWLPVERAKQADRAAKNSDRPPLYCRNRRRATAKASPPERTLWPEGIFFSFVSLRVPISEKSANFHTPDNTAPAGRSRSGFCRHWGQARSGTRQTPRGAASCRTSCFLVHLLTSRDRFNVFPGRKLMSRRSSLPSLILPL